MRAAQESCKLRAGSGWSGREHAQSRRPACTIARCSRSSGEYLDKARNEHRYDELVLVAPPKFLGMLRKELGKEVEKLVADEVPKDLSWFNTRELERYLAER